MKIALIGYGKMGKAIEEIALQRSHEVTLAISRANTADFNTDNLSKVDVAIEFTNPHSAFENVKKCLDAGIPLVCGSTGWADKMDSYRMEEIKQLVAEKDTAFIYASNFSVGVNIFFEVNKKLGALMGSQPGYDVVLEEIHHTQKKDAPSGTAITLAEQVLEQVKRKTKWVNQLSDKPGDLSIISQRVDPAPGTHHVKYSSAIDTIEIIHTAHNRKGFAMGAVLAAEFIKEKKGVFTMKDVLGI